MKFGVPAVTMRRGYTPAPSTLGLPLLLLLSASVVSMASAFRFGDEGERMDVFGDSSLAANAVPRLGRRSDADMAGNDGMGFRFRFANAEPMRLGTSGFRFRATDDDENLVKKRHDLIDESDPAKEMAEEQEEEESGTKLNDYLFADYLWREFLNARARKKVADKIAHLESPDSLLPKLPSKHSSSGSLSLSDTAVLPAAYVNAQQLQQAVPYPLLPAKFGPPVGVGRPQM